MYHHSDATDGDSGDEELDRVIARHIASNARLRAPAATPDTLSARYPRAQPPGLSRTTPLADEIALAVEAWLIGESNRSRDCNEQPRRDAELAVAESATVASHRIASMVEGARPPFYGAAAADAVEKMDADQLREYPCPICLQSFTRTAFSMLLPCYHRYCYGCISAWLRVSPATVRCPVCNTAPGALVYSIRSSSCYKVRDVAWLGTASAMGGLPPSGGDCGGGGGVR